MKKKSKGLFFTGLGFIASFVLWTVLVRFVDVHQIGPLGSSVGFATLNAKVHELTGVNWFLYTLTDWLGLIPIYVALGFAILGLVQWIKRRSLIKVDKSLLALGGFYTVVISAYLFFETVVINYRPVLINGRAEASYPSSTTMLVLCVMTSAVMQSNLRIKRSAVRLCIYFVSCAYTAFMVIGRLLAGVHWFTDIVGGILLSTGLAITYYSLFLSGTEHKATVS